jgi:hypothetical protein
VTAHCGHRGALTATRAACSLPHGRWRRGCTVHSSIYTQVALIALPRQDETSMIVLADADSVNDCRLMSEPNTKWALLFGILDRLVRPLDGRQKRHSRGRSTNSEPVQGCHRTQRPFWPPILLLPSPSHLPTIQPSAPLNRQCSIQGVYHRVPDCLHMWRHICGMLLFSHTTRAPHRDGMQVSPSCSPADVQSMAR